MCQNKNMRQATAVNVASTSISTHRKCAKQMVPTLENNTFSYVLLSLVLQFTSITLHTSHAFPINPVETFQQYIDDEHSKRYIGTNIQRRDVLDLVRCASLASVVGGATVCHGLTPSEAQQNYDTYATSYDQLDGGIASELLGLDTARKLLIQQARGKVLEVGVGTGLNLQYYKGDQVTSLDLVDISDGMRQVAMSKIATLSNLQNIPIRFIKADMTTELEQKFGLESYDTIVDTFSMCVLGDEGTRQCLDQMSRVVRGQGGQILLLENSRSSNPFLGGYQDATAGTAANVGGRGCMYNQNIRQLIQSNRRIRITSEAEFATGLFRSFCCIRNI